VSVLIRRSINNLRSPSAGQNMCKELFFSGPFNKTQQHNQIRAQRFGYVQRMSDDGMVKKMYKWKPITTRIQGRPKSRRGDHFKQDIGKMKINNRKV
jgi:hypothetical protein